MYLYYSRVNSLHQRLRVAVPAQCASGKNVQSTRLSYDSNGNLTGDGTNTYTFDARNHLTASSGGSNPSFVYDGFGRRLSETVSGTTTQFLYDGLNPVQELNVSNVATANLLTGLKIDEVFSRTDSSGARSFLTDILGSARADRFERNHPDPVHL
jgi:YD repeat-containing protein